MKLELEIPEEPADSETILTASEFEKKNSVINGI